MIPVVDVSRADAVEAVARACEEIGFLTVVGHGVSDALVERTAAVSRAFFDLPPEEKLRLSQGEPRAGVPAYRPLKSERLAASIGQVTPGDLKESLDWGPAVEGYGWPERPADLRETWREYYEALSGLGARLRRLFALALGLREDWFEPAFRGHGSSMRVINYPEQAQAAEPGQLRAGAHTDYGCLTILRTENAPGGLQVQARSGEWIDVQAPAGSFVVNLGDMMARWTNDRWVATLHRVVNPPLEEGPRARRQTLVFFHEPRPDAVIECIETCLAPGEEPRYPPVTALDHVLGKAAKAQQTPAG